MFRLSPSFFRLQNYSHWFELSCQVKISCAGGVTTVKEVLATALGLEPLLNAMTFTVALLVRVIVPVYRVDDGVGIEPSVV